MVDVVAQLQAEVWGEGQVQGGRVGEGSGGASSNAAGRVRVGAHSCSPADCLCCEAQSICCLQSLLAAADTLLARLLVGELLAH